MNYDEVAFGDIVELITNKVNASEISICNYISTDNMLRNCGGVTYASSLPAANKFNAFSETDTLFSNIRTYFRKVWFAGFSGGASADVLIFRSKNSSFLDPHFLYYVVSNKTFVDYTNLTSKGAKMPRGDKDAIAKYQLKLPPLDEQKAIASVLSALDDKIENNRRMNETLEEMARAIFKSWFVDFDPVHAKAAGNAPAHMDADTAALFPSSFGDDGLPEGWDNKTLGDIILPKRGKTITKSKTKEGTIPVVAGGLEPAYFHNQSNVEAPVVTISASGANAGFTRLYNENIWASDCSYISKQLTDTIYFWYVFLKTNQQKIYHMQQGAAQPHIYPSDLMRLELTVPNDNKLIQHFENLISTYFQKISIAQKESKTLAELRDTLLPKLMSGEIRVKDAERAVEEAV